MWMAIYRAENHTVLIDWPIPQTGINSAMIEHYAENPQAVLAGALRCADEPLTAFCADHATIATVIGWDRVYESVIVREFQRSGLFAQTITWGGQAIPPSDADDAAAVPMDSALVENPNVDGIRHALKRRGISPDAVFGDVGATVIRVEAPNNEQASRES
jgi:hypothetical protein